MRRHLAYLKAVLRHKWYVLLSGLKLGVPVWQLIIHDWDKFTPGMWFAYANTFNKLNGDKQYDPDPNFDSAWLGHQNRNKHHWQRWVLLEDSGKVMPLFMPLNHAKEMLADWQGAGRAYGNSDTKGWYLKNKEKIQLHPTTRKLVEYMLDIDCNWETVAQIVLEYNIKT